MRIEGDFLQRPKRKIRFVENASDVPSATESVLKNLQRAPAGAGRADVGIGPYEVRLCVREKKPVLPGWGGWVV